MIVLLSPAKKIDTTELNSDLPKTLPRFSEQTKQLAEITARLSKTEIKSLMKLSDNLTEINYQRFQNLNQSPSEEMAKQAILSFTGDVYLGLNAKTLDKKDLEWAQNHIRILSGFYGLLRPLDGIHPYRLEMGTRLETPKGYTLYDFWGNSLSQKLNHDMESSQSNSVLNLASNEYSKVIHYKSPSHPVITCYFYEIKNGQAAPAMLYTKRARGMMARWVIDHQTTNPKALQEFNYGGYRYNKKASKETVLVFDRPHPKA